MNTQSTIFKTFFGTLVLLVFLLAPGMGLGQIQLAGWTFDAILAAPNTPPSVAANLGTQSGAATLYADGSNGSSTWITATFGNELSAFNGSTLNDPRTTPLAGMSYCPIGGTGFSANGKSMVIKYSMTGFQDPILTYATRGTPTGFSTQQWAWSTDNSTYTNFSTITGITATFALKTLDMSSINSLDQATTVYLRVTFTGASSVTGNNRLDNFVINATAASAGGPTKLAVTSINAGSSPSANTAFNVVVQAQDASSVPANVIANTDFTLSLATGSGSLGGTLTGTIAAGASLATVTGVTYNTAEAGISITATRTAGDVLTAGTSSLFTVLAAADHLAFVNVPTYGMINTNLSTFTVEARRPDNTVDANFQSNITVDKASGTGNLTGTNVKTPVAGVAAFNNLQLDAAGTYTLTATTGSVTPATTGNIEILASLSYRSKTSGAWNVIGTWETGNGSFWFDALEVPTNPGRDVLIRNGHSVTVPTGYNSGACKNLTVENSATLYANAIAPLSCFVYVYGDILNDGTIGGATDVIGFDIEGTSCQLSGSGSFIAARIAKFTATPNPITNFTINQNLTLTYTSASSAALRNGAASTTFNITLGAGKRLTIPNAKIDLTNCTFKMENNASLLDNGTITASTALNTTVERTITGASQSWHLLSSPVAAQAIDPAFTVIPATEYDFFAWDEPTSTWVNFKNTTIAPTWNTTNGSTNFTAGKGYLVEYLATNPTKLFQGTPNTGTVTYPLSKSGTGTFAAYNLAGNPYPSAIDWKALTGWDRSSLVNASGYDMSIWNDAVGNYGSFNSTGTLGTNGVTQYIPIGQGFMVKADVAGNLVMDNGIRVHSSQAFLKSVEEISNILRLKVSGNVNTYSDEIVVEFGHQDATGGAEKMFGFYESAPSLYTVKSTGNYSIDFRGEPGAVAIPVSFKAGIDGNYTLTASQLESFTSSTQITLEDIKTAKTQNLMQNPDYTFTAAKNDLEARFLLHFGGTFGLNDKVKDLPVNIYSSGNSVYISDKSGAILKGEVIVYNMIGQPVMSSQLSENPLTKVNLSSSTGYYLVKVITGDNAYSCKVFIN